MDNIYQETVRAVEEGAGFKVDFRHRSLKVGGKHVIRDGKYEGTLGMRFRTVEEFLATAEELYCRYKHSVPSERSESKSRLHFRALPERDLDNDSMLYGQRRDKAQIELELYVLCGILTGFEWNTETMGRWFWQSRKDKDLVILRSWVEPDSKQLFNI